jgi:hypothetical protein
MFWPSNDSAGTGKTISKETLFSGELTLFGPIMVRMTRPKSGMGAMPGKGLLLASLVGVSVLASGSLSAQGEDKLLKKAEKLDAQLIKHCVELARKYDQEKIPEAAHFFASCAIGFGSKDDGMASIKDSWEVSVFIGRQQGGKVLTDLEPINTPMRTLSQEYRNIRDALWTPGVRGNLGDASKKLLRDAGVKMELTQSAGEYIKTVQRFNALRQSMGLRSVFWDCENSIRLVLAAWYMAQTGDYDDVPSKDSFNKDHVCYSLDVEDARKNTTRMPNHDLSAYPELLRGFALSRQDLLNPNARAIILAHWTKGLDIRQLVLYSIPQMPYREDIPTPTARFADETLVQKWNGWVDVEETVLVKGRKVPFVRYPYAGQPDAPCRCYAGEDGWQKSEYEYLDKGGTPIMCRFFSKGLLANVEAEFSKIDGKKLSSRIYLNGDRRVRLQTWATILLVPESPLERGNRYSVKLKCTLDGVDLENIWQFTAGSD